MEAVFEWWEGLFQDTWISWETLMTQNRVIGILAFAITPERIGLYLGLELNIIQSELFGFYKSCDEKRPAHHETKMKFSFWGG